MGGQISYVDFGPFSVGDYIYVVMSIIASEFIIELPSKLS